jgi:uncharacterized protein (DUF952 family)
MKCCRKQNDMKKIYHITTRLAWEHAQEIREYQDDSLQDVGFIHCSLFEQVSPTAKRYFNGQTGLIVLEIDEASLGNTVKYEMAAIGEMFPHIYGPLPVKSVIRVFPLILGPDGVYSWPVELGK